MSSPNLRCSIQRSTTAEDESMEAGKVFENESDVDISSKVESNEPPLSRLPAPLLGSSWLGLGHVRRALLSDRERPSSLGGSPISSWYHHSRAPHPARATTAQGRAICRNSTDKSGAGRSVHTPSSCAAAAVASSSSAAKQEADGAKKQPALSGSLRTQKPDKHPACSSTPWHPPSSTDGRPCWPMPHCKPSQPASSTRTAPISPMLKGTSHPGANSWPRPQAHPPSPAASQPLVKELWLGLGHLPCNAGATGIEMAALFVHMPGDCPVKQSNSQRLLRSKKEREKKQKMSGNWVKQSFREQITICRKKERREGKKKRHKVFVKLNRTSSFSGASSLVAKLMPSHSHEN